MARTIQIQLDEPDFLALENRAREREVTPEELLRQLARTSGGSVRKRTVGEKRAALEAAVRHEFPTADISTMLDEIEAGYRRAALP